MHRLIELGAGRYASGSPSAGGDSRSTAVHQRVGRFRHLESLSPTPPGFRKRVATSGQWVALNLLITVLLLYFVQGLAMIRAHLARWVGRGWFVRWGVALMCIYPPMPILVATLGVADSFFSLRPAVTDDGGNS